MRKLMLMLVIFFTTTIMVNNTATITKVGLDLAYKLYTQPQFELVYDDILGTVYHPVTKQCDNTPTITGDGSRIIPHMANEYRWIAVSQDLLYCEYRANLIKSDGDRFKGNIQYGDTIWVMSPHEEINGWWVVHDAMNKKYNNRIDFLQSTKDGIYGIFNDIKIYRVDNINYNELKKHLSV